MGKHAENAQMRYFHVVGRECPSEKNPEPKLYRMKIFAPNKVVARSRFWYFMKSLRRVKKAAGEIVSVNEIFDRSPLVAKNYAIWIRYYSRSGQHNLYKEFRDTHITGAVDQMYSDMASRHRADFSRINVIKVARIPSNLCRRPNVKQFHDGHIKFPLPHRIQRASAKKYKTVFKASRPNTMF